LSVRLQLGVLALAAASATAAASELTVFRPTDFIAQEWSYYIVIGGRALSDVRPGERVTLQVPSETRTVAIQCPKTLGGYTESRIDYDFKANATAYFLLSSRPDCVNIQPVDAKAAAALMRQTRVRASRPLEYDPARQAAAPTPAAAATVASAAVPVGDAGASVAAATAAWVEAFNSRDPGRLSALYDAEAVLSDTAEAKPRIGAAAIADYYRSAPQRPTQRVALGERNIRVFGDTAIDSGTYNFFEMRDGRATLTPARYTLVYRNRGGKWLIVDHQSTPATR
jgi:uncharacterized protein (TIGR02246 family)